jgi:hypothetical protein
MLYIQIQIFYRLCIVVDNRCSDGLAPGQLAVMDLVMDVGAAEFGYLSYILYFL